MALNKLKFNSLNVTPTAGKTIGFNSSANGLEATLSGGDMAFIKKLTASSSSTLSFVDGSSDVVLDSTYKEYMFIFNNIHSSAEAQFQVGFRDGDTDYDATKTTTAFRAYHFESDSGAGLGYQGGEDLAQSTGFQRIGQYQSSSDNDSSGSGYLHLFNPSSTTFVKHFIARVQGYYGGTFSIEHHTAGYCNVTAAIDGVQFKFNSGNIDSGTIKMYGVS